MKKISALCLSFAAAAALIGCDSGGDAALNPGGSAPTSGVQLPPGMQEMNNQKQKEGFSLKNQAGAKPAEGEGAGGGGGGAPGLPPGVPPK